MEESRSCESLCEKWWKEVPVEFEEQSKVFKIEKFQDSIKTCQITQIITITYLNIKGTTQAMPFRLKSTLLALFSTLIQEIQARFEELAQSKYLETPLATK